MENTLLPEVCDAKILPLGLTAIAKRDPDVKEMMKLIIKYDLRLKAVALLNQKLRKKRQRPRFFSS